MDKEEKLDIPSIEQLKEELAREESRYGFRKMLLNIAGMLVVAAAIAALLATRIFALIQINGNSMGPSLKDGEIVFLRQTKEVGKGDVVGFYYGGQILLKRVIGSAGDEIEIDREGNVFVNSIKIDEPYVEKHTPGKCDQSFPYRVPEGTVFVLGDNRAVSVDSRMKAIGCVRMDQIVGKVVFRAWPSGRIGRLQ